MKWDDCGEEKDDVIKCLCPYAQDIDDKDVDCFLCPSCFRNRADEI